MCGGSGTRVWPESRETRPKQLLDVLTPGETLVQATLARVKEFARPEDVLVVTSEKQLAETARQLPELPAANIISEPFGRNTAACIALSAHILKSRLPEDTVMVVLPADHVIRKLKNDIQDPFQKILERSGNAAKLAGGQPGKNNDDRHRENAHQDAGIKG